jgi:hypothetical protein
VKPRLLLSQVPSLCLYFYISKNVEAKQNVDSFVRPLACLLALSLTLKSYYFLSATQITTIQLKEATAYRRKRLLSVRLQATLVQKKKR